MQPQWHQREVSEVLEAPNRGGFTLIELMVVIVLVGIASAMIVPEMKGSYEHALLRSATRELVDVFHLAYSRSISMNQIHRVRLQRSGEYQIESAVKRGGTLEFHALRDLPGYSGKVDPRISVRLGKSGAETDSPEAESAATPGLPKAIEDGVLFYPDGTADAVELQLHDRNGFGVRLQLNPVTANVRVSETARK